MADSILFLTNFCLLLDKIYDHIFSYPITLTKGLNQKRVGFPEISIIWRVLSQSNNYMVAMYLCYVFCFFFCSSCLNDHQCIKTLSQISSVAFIIPTKGGFLFSFTGQLLVMLSTNLATKSGKKKDIV